MTENSQPIFDFTDADLKAALRRAFRTTAIVGGVLAVALGIMYGWQTGVLVLAGTVISITGLWEWQRLVAFINARLDKQKATGTGRIVSGFFLRLLFAGGILYVSLKCLHGSVYALVAGLVLGIFALTIEAVRMIRS